MSDLVRTKNELAGKVKELNELCFDDKSKKSYQMKQLENKMWKKYKFFDEYIKAERRVKKWKI
jgi:hypothetical protein